MEIAWTTVESADDAERLARGAVETGLAACAQTERITSFYRWKGALERAEEWRICFKTPAERASELESWVLANHPYETPEWVVVAAERVGEKYAAWAREA